jgi:hypothetical protein
MEDIRLIKVLDTDQVVFTEEFIDQPISGRDAAIQRFMIALHNTPGTMIDFPSWGGGAYRLILSIKSKSIEQARLKVGEVVDRAMSSLEPYESGDFAIIGAPITNVERLPGRGLGVSLNLLFQNGLTARIRVAGAVSVT